MKLRVQHEDGNVETISIVAPVEIDEGRTLAHMRSAEGLEHFFTLDGYYDGWAKSTVGLENSEVDELVGQIEKDREIEPPK